MQHSAQSGPPGMTAQAAAARHCSPKSHPVLVSGEPTQHAEPLADHRACKLLQSDMASGACRGLHRCAALPKLSGTSASAGATRNSTAGALPAHWPGAQLVSMQAPGEAGSAQHGDGKAPELGGSMHPPDATSNASAVAAKQAVMCCNATAQPEPLRPLCDGQQHGHSAPAKLLANAAPATAASTARPATRNLTAEFQRAEATASAIECFSSRAPPLKRLSVARADALHGEDSNCKSPRTAD